MNNQSYGSLWGLNDRSIGGRSMEKEKVLSWIDENENDIIGFLQETLRISSVNPWFGDHSYPTKEQEIQEYLEKYIQEIGFETFMWEPNSEKLSKYEGRA